MQFNNLIFTPSPKRLQTFPLPPLPDTMPLHSLSTFWFKQCIHIEIFQVGTKMYVSNWWCKMTDKLLYVFRVWFIVMECLIFGFRASGLRLSYCANWERSVARDWAKERNTSLGGSGCCSTGNLHTYWAAKGHTMITTLQRRLCVPHSLSDNLSCSRSAVGDCAIRQRHQCCSFPSFHLTAASNLEMFIPLSTRV